MAVNDEVWLYTDGGSRGNPGPAAIGFLITDATDRPLAEHAECIGRSTNNYAEYSALVRGLAECARFTQGRVHCVADSELIVRQMHGEYRVKDAALQARYEEAKQLERQFSEVSYAHQPREEQHIVRVDRLVNLALDKCSSIAK